MNLLRILLFPLSIIYGIVTSIRNLLFDKGILKSTSFPVPIIAVGNLSVGGTGKTPQIEYLIRLLSEKYKVATLSRGYKRKSKGFVLGDEKADAEILGDEPFQYYQKFPQVQVAVDANRTNGIQQLLAQNNPPEVILLDDAFQHRKVKAGLYILLTAYGDLYCDDFMLPTGNLRESRSGVRRAQIVIVTKCPENLSLDAKNKIKLKFNLDGNQKLFFTSIGYNDEAISESGKILVSELKKRDKLLLAGIAKPEPFFNYLKKEGDAILNFPDHHHFSDAEISDVKVQSKNKLIVTTEKDYVRIKSKFPVDQLFYVPIQSIFLEDKDIFDDVVSSFVRNFEIK